MSTDHYLEPREHWLDDCPHEPMCDYADTCLDLSRETAELDAADVRHDEEGWA